jgi:hypothetical protein
LVDAHVSAFANTSLNFNAHASVGTVNQNYNWEYNYELAFLYRIGLAALAQIKFYGEWRSRAYYPVDWQKIHLWGPDEPIKSGVLSPPDERRMVRRWYSSWTDDPLPNTIFDTPRLLGWDTENKPLGSHGFLYGNATLDARQEDNQAQDDSKSNLEFTIAGNKFTCNDAPATCGGTGPDNTDDLQTRGLGSWLGSISGQAGGLKKRATGTDNCRILPRLYYNCDTAFYDYTFIVPIQQGGTGLPNEMPGICQTLQRYMAVFTAVSVDRPGRKPRAICKDGGCTLTYDSDRKNARIRRGQACPTTTTGSYCKDDNDDRELQLWGSLGHRPGGGLTSCDEFPFASSEEGGDNYDSEGEALSSIFDTQRVCVPTWQQNLQANCNGKSIILILIHCGE